MLFNNSEITILIADTSTRVCDYIAQSLAGSGVVTHTCNSSSDVIPMYEKHLPDIVLIELRLSPESGIETTKALKARYPNARIVMLTSHNETEYRSSAREAGAAGLLVKDHLVDLHTVIAVMH